MKVIPAKLRISKEEYEAIKKDYGTNPCNICDMAKINLYPCTKICENKSKWNNQFTNMPNELKELALKHNRVYELDKELDILRSKIDEINTEKFKIITEVAECIIKDF